MVTYIIYYHSFSILIYASCLILNIKFEKIVKMSTWRHSQMHPKPEDNHFYIIEYRENWDETIDLTLKSLWWTFKKNKQMINIDASRTRDITVFTPCILLLLLQNLVPTLPVMQLIYWVTSLEAIYQLPLEPQKALYHFSPTYILSALIQ